jgi:hypothetical protein
VRDVLPGTATHLRLDDGTLVPMIEDASRSTRQGVVLLNPGFIT